MLALDWGNVPSWLSPLIAAIALIFTARSARYSRKSAAAAQGQIIHRNRKEWKEQASNVAGWISVNIDAETKKPLVYLHYVNANAVPAYNFVATLESCYTRRLKMGILAPTEGVRTVQFPAASDWIRQAIEAKMSTFQQLPFGGSSYEESTWIETHSRAYTVQQSGVSVQFQDSYGVIWRRDADGVLQETTIDEDRGWKGTVLGGQEMNRTAPSEEESFIVFDVLATDTEHPQRSEMLPNMRWYAKDGSN